MFSRTWIARKPLVPVTGNGKIGGMSEARGNELKYELSSRIVRHIAEIEGMTPAEYGGVYDSEQHEQLLNDLMRLITEDALTRGSVPCP